MVSEPKSNGAATAMAGKKVVVPEHGVRAKRAMVLLHSNGREEGRGPRSGAGNSEEQMLQFHVMLLRLGYNMVSEPKSNGAATAMAGKKVVVPGPAQEIPKSKCCSSM
ncbi:hypothetical protein PR202_ga26781 [Eleusine coracana subsp. coracana]|uniref:Uncharacterized protein n=1 Tax=Eleusine coracana subsp. coracana TaxID=191504 RepID=A0AAV5DEQ2_ELECO|nr:hypothetical protein PR202_ga26781 [Eleusine coracana subsp. coracana]